MKKIGILFFFSVFLLSAINAQTYTLQMNSDIETYLELYPNNRYIIKTSYKGAPDFMMSTIFSFGTYKIEPNQTYVFTDKTHGFDMKMEIASKTTKEKVLFVKDAFGWMENNYFVMSSQKAVTPVNITDNFLTKDEVVSFRNKNKAETCPVKIENGRYKSGMDGYSLILNSDKTYSLHFYNVLLSKGNWVTENNFLVLADADVNKHFYGIINNDGSIRSALFPGEFNTTTFKQEGK